MHLTEEMISSLVLELHGSYRIRYNAEEVDFTPPWRSITMENALKELAGVDLSQIKTTEDLVAYAKGHGIEGAERESRGRMITKIFEELCEKRLIQPTFITRYPIEVSPLAKRSKEDPSYAERFELYICGMEIANGFNELNNPEDQRERFLEQIRQKEEGAMMDEDYIMALEYGLPPTAGEGIGIDRLTMLLTDSPSIREVILFPLLKP
jgi:lysyl-tRNA synthetase class 2